MSRLIFTFSEVNWFLPYVMSGLKKITFRVVLAHVFVYHLAGGSGTDHPNKKTISKLRFYNELETNFISESFK